MNLETPKRYSELLTRLGGKNLFGEPNFILQWGLSAVRRYAVPDAFLAPYLNAWCLAEWTPAEEFGSPADWDEEECGPYPFRGLYTPIQVFREGSEPIMLDTEYLNLEVLKLFLWVALNHKHDSLQKRMDFLKDQKAQADAQETKRLIDLIEDGAPAFLDSASFSEHLNCNTVVKQRIEALERNWDRVTSAAARFPRGGLLQRSL